MVNYVIISEVVRERENSLWVRDIESNNHWIPKWAIIEIQALEDHHKKIILSSTFIEHLRLNSNDMSKKEHQTNLCFLRSFLNKDIEYYRAVEAERPKVPPTALP